MTNAVGSALGGLSTAQSMFDVAAAKVVSGELPVESGPGGDIAAGMTDAVVASASYQANLVVLRAALDNQGALVELLA